MFAIVPVFASIFANMVARNLIDTRQPCTHHFITMLHKLLVLPFGEEPPRPIHADGTDDTGCPVPSGNTHEFVLETTKMFQSN